MRQESAARAEHQAWGPSPRCLSIAVAMRVVASDRELESSLRTPIVMSRDYPVAISRFISGAKEAVDSLQHAVAARLRRQC
eukprot:6048055-Alexandrium_andersonii.AAC.1